MKRFERRIKRLEKELMVGEFEYPEWWDLFKAIDPGSAEEMDILLRKYKYDPEYVLSQWGWRIPNETLLEVADRLEKNNRENAEEHENNDVSKAGAATDVTAAEDKPNNTLKDSPEDTKIT